MRTSLQRLVGGLMVVMVGLAQSVAAQPAPGGNGGPSPQVGASVRASTLGYGAEVALALNPTLNVRGGFNWLNLTDAFEVDDDNVLYNGTIRLRSGHVFVDWFPFSTGFHLSPGLVFANGNRATLTGVVPAGEFFSIGDDTYVSGPTPVAASAEVTFAQLRPAMTVGWGNLVPRSRRWSIPFELGIVFTGRPRNTLDFAGTVCNMNGTNCRSIASDPAVQAQIREEERRMNDDVKVLRFYPILSVGFAYRF